METDLLLRSVMVKVKYSVIMKLMAIDSEKEKVIYSETKTLMVIEMETERVK